MEEQEYLTVGNHIAADFWGVDFDKLNNIDYMYLLLKVAAELSGATVLDQCLKQFNPNGCTVLLLLSESHVSIHTYPEKGYAGFDMYTCGNTVDPLKGFKIIKERLNPTRVHIKELKRGLGEDEPIQVFYVEGE
jgi:S-adenosylmethionine decarboxylase